ncbi:hypothetical protein ACS0TY_028296 [Phlomoides rotata]
MEPGDTIIDGGNGWFENTERRMVDAAANGLLYLGMGVSGGEDGARNGPSLMPGGSHRPYLNIHHILEKIGAQVDDGPCATYIGEGGSGNFVKMVHNGIEYGDMQLISEAYDVLKNAGGLGNEELAEIFGEWNRGELESFLIAITPDIFKVEDEESGKGHLVDEILDKIGMKGTGKWTVQQAAELSIAAPTVAASLDNKKRLIDDVRRPLYASKICSYAQGMNLLRAKSMEKGCGLNLGELARIWNGGCIIRAVFLDRINQAYQRNPGLANLLVDPTLRGRWCRDKEHGGELWVWQFRRVLVFRECLQVCSILIHRGVGDFLLTLCRLRGTTLEHILMRGLIALKLTTLSGRSLLERPECRANGSSVICSTPSSSFFKIPVVLRTLKFLARNTTSRCRQGTCTSCSEHEQTRGRSNWKTEDCKRRENRKKSGVVWQKSTNTVYASQEKWENLIKMDSFMKVYMYMGDPLYDTLKKIFQPSEQVNEDSEENIFKPLLYSSDDGQDEFETPFISNKKKFTPFRLHDSDTKDDDSEQPTTKQP